MLTEEKQIQPQEQPTQNLSYLHFLHLHMKATNSKDGLQKPQAALKYLQIKYILRIQPSMHSGRKLKSPKILRNLPNLKFLKSQSPSPTLKFL